MLTILHAHSANGHDSFVDTQVIIDEAVHELEQVQRLEDGDRLFDAVKSVADVCKDLLEDDRILEQNLDRIAKIQLDVPSPSSRNALARALDGLRLGVRMVSILLL